MFNFAPGLFGTSRQTKDSAFLLPPDSIVARLRQDTDEHRLDAQQRSGADLTLPVSATKNIDLTVSANVTYIRKCARVAPELNGTWIDGPRIGAKASADVIRSRLDQVCRRRPPRTVTHSYCQSPHRRQRRAIGKRTGRSLRNGDAAQGYVENRQESGQPPCPRLRRRTPTSRSTDSTLRHQLRIPGRRQDGRPTAISCSRTAPTITMPVWPLHRVYPLTPWTPEKPQHRRARTRLGRQPGHICKCPCPTAGSSEAQQLFTINQHHRRLHLFPCRLLTSSAARISAYTSPATTIP